MVQPPASLIPGGMVFGVMDGTERHGELIAHLQSEPLRLRIANVMSVRWRTAADEARLPGDKSQMLLRSMPLDLTKFEHALGGLSRFDDAERALLDAEALLPEKDSAFERSEFLQAVTELQEIKGGPPGAPLPPAPPDAARRTRR